MQLHQERIRQNEYKEVGNDIERRVEHDDRSAIVLAKLHRQCFQAITLHKRADCNAYHSCVEGSHHCDGGVYDNLHDLVDTEDPKVEKQDREFGEEDCERVGNSIGR